MLRYFVLAEVIVYTMIGFGFLAGSIGMLVFTMISFVDTFQRAGFPFAIVALINDLLLVMIFMEVLRTIVSYLEEQSTTLRPFLFIAAISATRRVLAVGANMALADQGVKAQNFEEAMIDLGVNGVLILMIALALFLLNRYRAPPAPTDGTPPLAG